MKCSQFSHKPPGLSDGGRVVGARGCMHMRKGGVQDVSSFSFFLLPVGFSDLSHESVRDED